MAYALRDLGRFDEAIAQCEAALALTEQTPSALTMRPRVLDCLSLTAMEQGRTELAVQAVEEAAELSRALGQLDDETNALTTATFIYGQADRIAAASTACGRAVQLAQRSGNLILQGNVLRAQAIVLQWQQRPRAALEAGRRSLALWARSGHQVGRDWAMAHVLELMCEADDLDAFEADYLAFVAQPALSSAMRHSARSSHAAWLWKQGHRQQAADALSLLANEIDCDALQMRNSVGDELVFMRAQLGEVEKARLELARLPSADRPIRRARSLAAVELAAGNAAVATRLLRNTWESKDGYGVGAADLLADHAWLLVEQWSPGDSTTELESLHAHALDHPDDFLPSTLFRAAWRLRSDPQAEHARQWDAAVRGAARRLQSFSWISEPMFREQLAGGTPRALPVLLTRAFN